ncbi:hypothetical protein J6590_018877 [Homalodisca vitripennis]|nr:hypothetical protein J6590_018877 [Homalodisca vitripennis]
MGKYAYQQGSVLFHTLIETFVIACCHPLFHVQGGPESVYNARRYAHTSVGTKEGYCTHLPVHFYRSEMYRVTHDHRILQRIDRSEMYRVTHDHRILLWIDRNRYSPLSSLRNTHVLYAHG